MSQLDNTSEKNHVTVVNPVDRSSVVVVCEHASRYIPSAFNDLGLTGDALQSHAAWDPGAMPVARGIAARLNAALVASGVSRLVYDCNRPPEATDAMPAKSEVFDVPGNTHLTAQQRKDRTAAFYDPFRKSLAEVLASNPASIVVTVHSFTPVYDGQRRSVEIGVLHDSDDRLANAMLEIASSYLGSDVQRNVPYGPEDGVTHTLKEHALPENRLNVMLEVRNDLIATQDQQDAMADAIARWLSAAIALLDLAEVAECRV